MNVVDLILFQCRYQPAVAAICVPGADLDLISYGRLERFIHNISRNALAHGLARGDVVALSFDDRILHAAFILGLSRLGIATLSTHDLHLPRQFKTDAVISDAPRPVPNAGRFIQAGTDWTEGDDLPLEQKHVDRSGGNQLCRISMTSGTTGDASPCGFSHDMLIRRIGRYSWVYGNKAADCSRIFIDPGISTYIGFTFFLYALAKGGTVFFRGDEATETMQALGLYKVQYMVAAPAALAQFVELYEQAPGFPAGLEAILSLGSLLSKSLSERIRARLCANLFSSYGATEVPNIATAPAHTIADVPGAVGYVTPATSVEIVNDRGDAVAPGQEGTIRVRSELALDGYLGDPIETAKTFRDGCFYPGDIGTLSTDGLLTISGRETAVLNLGGDKVNPERIEQVLTSFPGIAKAAVFSISNAMGIEELHAAIVAPSFDESALRVHCTRHLAPKFVPQHFRAMPDIRVNHMGKIDRKWVAEIARQQSPTTAAHLR